MLSNVKKEIDLNIVFENNNRMNTHAESKSYYALVLLGLLSVPLFSLLVEMLTLKLFDFYYNKILFIISLVLLLLSLFALIYSFIPRMAVKPIHKNNNDVNFLNNLSTKYNEDYYYFRFWANLKNISLSIIEQYFNDSKIIIIGNFSLLTQIIHVAEIAKIKFLAFNISIILQAFLFIVMVMMSIVLIFTYK